VRLELRETPLVRLSQRPKSDPRSRFVGARPSRRGTNLQTDRPDKTKIVAPLKLGIYRARLRRRIGLGKYVTARMTVHVVDRATALQREASTIISHRRNGR